MNEPGYPARKNPLKVWLIGGEDIRLRIPLLDVLRRLGFTVGAVGSEPVTPFTDAEIPYWRYPLRRRPSPIADVISWRALRRLFMTHRPDVVHAFDTKPTYLVPSAARRAGVRGAVCTITGMGYLFSSDSALARTLRPVYRHLQQRACRDSDVTVFQNEDDQRYFLEQGMVEPGRDRLVRGSGVDFGELMGRLPGEADLARLRSSLGLEGRQVVTMVTRLVVHKGIREFIEAANTIGGGRSDVAFLLVGPYSAEARGAITPEEVLSLGTHVDYLGPRNDVAALLSISDICVLPSYYREGVPRVLLEAGALGLPLIATDMPGCRDVVRDGWNGALIPPRDGAALASAISRMLDSESERSRMGEKSREHVMDGFSLEHVAGAYADIYRGIAGSAGVDEAGVKTPAG